MLTWYLRLLPNTSCIWPSLIFCTLLPSLFQCYHQLYIFSNNHDNNSADMSPLAYSLFGTVRKINADIWRNNSAIFNYSEAMLNQKGPFCYPDKLCWTFFVRLLTKSSNTMWAVVTEVSFCFVSEIFETVQFITWVGPLP